MIINGLEYKYEFQVKEALHEYVESFASHKEAAAALDVGYQYLSNMLHHRQGLPDKVLSKLGYARVEMFLKIEKPEEVS